MTATAQFVIDEQNPWPGLRSFDEESERFFNGRRKESAELRRLVTHAPLTVLFGASGLGKTSLIQAGLFPLLRKEHYLPVYVRLDLRDRSTPLIDQVKFALRGQLQSQRIDAPAFNGDESLWQYLHRSGLELWSKHNQLLNPLFVLDQFEELFTLGAERATAIAQLRIDLADLIENRMPAALAKTAEKNEEISAGLSMNGQRYKVLMSLREDFLPAVEGWKRELPSILRNRLRLLPMSGEQAFEAVHTSASYLVDEPLARQIVRFVAAAQEDGTTRVSEPPESMPELEVEPALLSVMCHGLNEKRKVQGKAAFDEALLSGTGQSIISDYYQDAVGDLPDRVQRFIEKELITERGFRKPCDVDDASRIHGVSDQDLRRLVDRRLLRIEPQRRTDRVELTHDLLTRVVREHRDRQRERERVRRQWRRMALLSVIGVVFAALAFVFFLLSQNATKQAAIANSRRLATIVILKKDAQLDLASLLSLEAQRTADTFEARHALFVVFQSRPLLWTSFHHSSTVRTVAFNLDGRLLASGSDDGTARLWDIETRRQVGEPLRSRGGNVWSVAFSPNGKILATGSDDGTVRLWDVESRQPPVELHGHHDRVRSVAFGRGGSMLATASDDKTVRLWNLVTRTSTEARLGDDTPCCVAFSPNSKVLVLVGSSGTVYLWDVASGRAFGNPLRGEGNVYSLALSPDGKVLAMSQGNANTVQMWDLASRLPLNERLKDFKGEDPVAFSPDGKTLAAADQNGTIRLLDLASRYTKKTLPGYGSRVEGLAFSPNGRMLASANFDGTIQLWDLVRRQTSEEPMGGHEAGNRNRSLAFSPDGKLLALASTDPAEGLGHLEAAGSGKVIWVDADVTRKVRLWNVRTRQLLEPALSGHKKDVNCVAFSPDGKALASASTDKSVRLWDVSSGEALGEPLRGHTGAVWGVAFSPDGKMLASGSEDKSVRLWDVSSHKPIWEAIQGHIGDVLSVSFSPDGKLLATASEDKTVRLWNVANGQAIGEPLQGHTFGVTSVVFSPDGKTLASAGGS